MSKDLKTAEAFATSWNNLPAGSVYTRKQFEDWFAPLKAKDIEGKTVLELGCGNASLMVHLVNWQPDYVEGVDLGDSVNSAQGNMESTGFADFKITKADLTTIGSTGFDLVYSIGVLHHLKDPQKGLDAVIRNVKPGGRFHCWVYAYEGNWVVRRVVDPMRKMFSKFPWWFTKYVAATTMVLPYYCYAKFLQQFPNSKALAKLPLFDYSLWIAEREFAFFRHVAFDQLVTPQTVYIKKAEIMKWLNSYPEIDKNNCYVRLRNGNSWKFGGVIKK